MLKFENVSLKYGSFLALDKVSLHADKGELVVLLGANGAGKSSLFLTASGIHQAAGGSITWEGQGAGRQQAQHHRAIGRGAVPRRAQAVLRK